MPKSKSKSKVSSKLQPWVDARKRFRLSDAHVQMARELGMNPKKLGGLANHKQQPWKAPLPVFIEDLYEKRFGRRSPETVVSLEELERKRRAKKEARKERRQRQREAERSGLDEPGTS
jgi:hypothetical protein